MSKRPRRQRRPTSPGGVPPEIVLPQMQLAGNREAVIEHCGGITSYNDTCVRLEFGKGEIEFTGVDLTLKSMTATSVVVSGYFTSIAFLDA